MEWLRTKEELTALVSRDRLRPVLIRYRGETEGRVTTAAMYADDIITMLERTGRYVRDMEVLRHVPNEAVSVRSKRQVTRDAALVERLQNTGS